MGRLDDKVCIVTGASAGIGRATAVLFAQEGARVLAAARREDRLQELCEECEALPGTVRYCVTDVRDPAAVKRMLAAAVEEFGRLDVAVNNAGIMDDNTAIADMSDEMLDETFRTNTFGLMYCMREECRQFLAQGDGGVIVNICSVGASHQTAGAAYCASKGACDLMIQSMACDLSAKYGINVNSINPTVFRSDLTEWMFDPDSAVYQNFLKREPIGRLAEPYDFVGFALFLSSDASAFMTGGNYDCSGGYLTC